MSDTPVLTKDVAADLERLICDLADIGDSSDVDARRKAKRLYTEMRLKYPVSVQDAVEPTGCPHCREVYEIWANTEGFQPMTAPESYQRDVIEQMRAAAAKGLGEVNRGAK